MSCSDERCAYLVSRYPGVTHTFVVGEVRALREAGVRVETASVRRVADEEMLSDSDHDERRRTRALVPATPRQLAGAHGRALRRGPRAYTATLVRALRLAHGGGRARLWQLFYFGESMLLWDWMRHNGLRHVHVHHANVSADVAMLACAFANRTGGRALWTWSMTIHGPTELLDVTTHKLAVKATDAAVVICISDFARSQLAALLEPAALGRVHTIRCGIDLAAFRPRPGTSSPRAATQVLCVAALSRRKGHRVLLEAFARVLEERPDVRLTLAGDGPERGALEALSADLGIASAVHFEGAVGHDRVTDLYQRADLFCLPSFAEGIPTVLMEAMAMELAVIASDVMGIPELVEHERSGLLVAPARPDLLAQALLLLVADPALRERMGRAGRARVLRDYDRDGAVAALHAALAPLMRAGPAVQREE